MFSILAGSSPLKTKVLGLSTRIGISVFLMERAIHKMIATASPAMPVVKMIQPAAGVAAKNGDTACQTPKVATELLMITTAMRVTSRGETDGLQIAEVNFSSSPCYIGRIANHH